MAVYTVGPLYLNTGAGGSLLDQVQDLGFSPNVRRLFGGGDGLPDPSHAAVAGLDADFSFTCTDLGTLLALASGAFVTAGLALSSSNKGEFYFRQMANTGERATGSTHLQLLVNKGLMVPTGISASHGGVASCSVQIAAVYDGSNDPVVLSAVAAIPGTPDVTALYTVGKVALAWSGGSVSLDDEVTSIALDTGIRLVRVGGGGKVWGTFVAIQDRAPSLRVSVTDAAVLATLGIGGKAITSGSVYFRRFQEGSAVYADNQLQHVKLALYEGWAGVTGLSAGGNGVAGPELSIELTKPTANAAIVATVGVAIT